jgi:ribosomal protein S18 acetylase RimI-like enzyme
MLIRKAISEDAHDLARLLLLAMEDIVYAFIGARSYEQAFTFLSSLTHEPNNQYSYEHCWVICLDDKIVGAALVYDGAQLSTLREPVAKRIFAWYGREFTAEYETQAGEMYIDCFAVDPLFQGKGMGTRLLRWVIEQYNTHQNKTLGLLVDKDNPRAKKLYESLGFEVVGEKTLVGKSLEHLQLKSK